MPLALATPITALVTTIVGEGADAYTQVQLTSGERVVITIPAALRGAYQDALPRLDRTRPVLTLAITDAGYSLLSVEGGDILIQDGFTAYVRTVAVFQPVAVPASAALGVCSEPLRRAA